MEEEGEREEEDRIVLDPVRFGDEEGGRHARERRVRHLALLVASVSSVVVALAALAVAVRYRHSSGPSGEVESRPGGAGARRSPHTT